MKPAVAEAIDRLRKQFGDEKVLVTALLDEGASVLVENVELGAPYKQSETWFGFTLTPLYPYADIYPHFVRPDLSRLDGKLLEPPLHINNLFYGRPAVMVSRRTQRTGSSTPNNAVLKLLKVQSWLRSL